MRKPGWLGERLPLLVRSEHMVDGEGGYPLGQEKRVSRPPIHAKRVRTADARYAVRNRSGCGAPALPEVLNLSSARRDRNAKPFPLWGGLAALSYL
jgi:hypothetical protein